MLTFSICKINTRGMAKTIDTMAKAWWVCVNKQDETGIMIPIEETQFPRVGYWSFRERRFAKAVALLIKILSKYFIERLSSPT